MGDLYDDKVYLEEFAKDPTFEYLVFPEVQELIQSGIAYLGQRLDFWRQDTPAYLLEKDHKERHKKWRGRPHAQPQLQPQSRHGSGQSLSDGNEKRVRASGKTPALMRDKRELVVKESHHNKI